MNKGADYFYLKKEIFPPVLYNNDSLLLRHICPLRIQWLVDFLWSAEEMRVVSKQGITSHVNRLHCDGMEK